MLVFDEVTKRYGRRTVVDRLSFAVHPGRVTGLLGPNGAGKSTTIRVALGLVTPTAGRATVGGVPYRSLRRPLIHVGALLDGGGVHGGRSGRDHLRALASSNDLPAARVDEVIELTGLAAVAAQRARTLSLGMRQRLGIAAALLGDPALLVLDEPMNGLDPHGIRWLRGLMRSLADEGRTVLVSSHLISELALAADHLVVIGRGRLLADAPVCEVAASEGNVHQGLVERLERAYARLTAPELELRAIDAGAAE